MIITSTHEPSLYADVTPSATGVRVTVYRRHMVNNGRFAVQTPIMCYSRTVDAPLHVVLDTVHREINQ